MIHCLTGIAIFYFARELFRLCPEMRELNQWGAAAISAWWLLLPLNVSTTFYIIQRMTQLSSLFTLLGLLCYLKGRKNVVTRPLVGWFWVAFGLLGFGALATLSKENGVLIFAFALVCELYICYSRGEHSPKYLRLILFLPLVMGFFYLLFFWSDFQARYEIRDFSVSERLMTESRILWAYLHSALVPFAGKMGLIHDDFIISRSIFQPITTFFSIAAHLLLLSVAFFYRRKFPLLFFGVGWFYVGHLLESTVIALELYYEHRNYLPVLGVLFVLVGLVAQSKRSTLFARVILGLIILASGYFTNQRAILWGDPVLQARVWAMEHPESVRAQTDLVGILISQKRYVLAQDLLEKMHQKWPNYLHIDLLIVKYQCSNMFSETDSGKSLFNLERQGVYTGNLPSAVRSVMKMYHSGHCVELDELSMLKLLSNLQGLTYTRREFESQIHFHKSEIYAKLGDVDSAIESLTVAISFRARSIYYYHKAVLLEMSGRIKEALVAAKRAQAIERRKPEYTQLANLHFRLLVQRIENKIRAQGGDQIVR